MSGTIYILQDGDFINSDVYKIGKTLCINTRLTQYSKNTLLHHTFCVDKNILDRVETKIIYHFNKKFNIVKGKEWFRGNIEKMIQEIKLIIDSFSEEKKDNYIEMFTCEFCNKEFTMKGNMISHQKTTKYCLEKQGKNLSENFKCEYCDKIFTLKNNLNEHISICRCKKIKEKEYNKNKEYDQEIKKIKDYYDEKINDLEEQNKKIKDKYKKDIEKYQTEINYLNKTIEKLESRLESYEKKLFEMVSKPNTTNTNTNNNHKTVVINDNDSNDEKT